MPCISLNKAVRLLLAVALLFSYSHHSLLAQTAPEQPREKESESRQAATSDSPPRSFEELAQQAATARQDGKSEEAAGYYEAALKVRPDWPDGWWYLGTLRADAGQYRDAISAFDKLLELKPDFGPGWASLGLCEFEIKNYDDSFTHLKRGQELGVDAVPGEEKAAIYHLALLLNVRGEFENAWELLASKFGRGIMPEQAKTALALALLRIPLLPDQLDPSKDALLDATGETAVLLVRGNFDQALQSFQQIAKDHPDTPFLHYAYGSALMFRSRYDEAEAQLRAETRVTPNSALPYMRLAIGALKTHQAARALPDASKAVELAPNSAMAHEILSRILTELGRAEQAAPESALAAKLKPERPQIDPDVARLYALRNIGSQRPTEIKENAAVTAGNPPTPLSSTDRFDDVMRRAVAASAAGHADDVIAYYRQAIEMRPDWEEGWSELGYQYYLSGQYSEAISALKNGIVLNPRHPELWVYLALCEFERKDYKNSYIHLERGRELGYHGNVQQMTVGVTRLAELRNLNGDFFGASELLIPEARRGRLTEEMKIVLGMSMLRIALLPNEVDASGGSLLHAAGETAALLYASRYDDTFRRFEQMLKDYPGTPFLRYAYASALETLSRYEEAERQLREEIKITPRSPLSWMRLASIELKLHHPEQALEQARHAVQLDSQAAGGFELMGRALLEMGNVEEAVKALETASKLAPNYPEVHFNLARAYTKAKMKAEADHERALFAELTDVAERGKTAEAQAYGVPQTPAEPASPPGKSASDTIPR
jgi:tetratricopeptide (TPR) repeat protein